MFEDYRINGRINVDSAIAEGAIIYDEEEQAGARDNKFWFNDYNFLYKDIYENTYEDYAELIGYEIASVLGLPCAEYDLAICDNRRGVITKSIVNEDIGEEMISGSTVLTSTYTEYILPLLEMKKKYITILEKYSISGYEEYKTKSAEAKEKFYTEILELFNNIVLNNTKLEKNKLEMDEEVKKILLSLNENFNLYNEGFLENFHGIKKSNNLYDIWSAIENYCKLNKLILDPNFMKDLTNMFVFDIITAQGDRHTDNWSIIVDANKIVRLSPLYDNSGIFALNREKAINSINEHAKPLFNGNLPEAKRNKIISFLQKIIYHSKSGLKIESEDVELRKINPQLMEKYISHSSQEYIEILMKFIEILKDETIIDIFNKIEAKTKIKMDDEVKKSVLLILNNNIEMINSILGGEKHDTRNI